MGYRIEVTDQAVITVFEADFDFQTELEAVDADMHAALDAFPQGAYLIVDVLHTSVGLKDAIYGTNFAVRGGTIVSHPNLRQIVVVSESSLVKLSAKGMNSPSFNNVDLAVFPTLEEAISYTQTTPLPEAS